MEEKRFPPSTDDLYDMYDMYDKYDIYNLYDLCDLFPLDVDISGQI